MDSSWGLIDTPEVSWRLAMAWDEWSEKIQHNPPEDWYGREGENQGNYEIPHDEKEGSYLLYSVLPESKKVYVDMLYTRPEHRNDGIAESLMRKLHQDHPDFRISPGNMTGDGQEFHDRMLQKEPTARDLVVGAEPKEEMGEIPDYQKIYARRRMSTAPTMTPNPLLENRINSYLSLGMPDEAVRVSQRRNRIAAVTQTMVDGLNDQFHEWWGSQKPSGGSVDDFAQADFMDEDRGPIGHWPNIENFLKDVYPAAHRGLASGMEAEWSLDGHAKPYLTGPEAIKQHGYDPSEIAAGVLLLHNKSDLFRGDMAQQDQDRLNDIAQKRFKMQRNYDSRQTQPAAKPLVNARRMFLAMAWDEWAPLIKGGCDDGCTYARDGTEGRYTIPQAGAFLDYYHYNHRGQDQVAVSGIYTHPSDRGDGVAEALIRRLSEDHPGIPIDPGTMTRDGQGFHDRMLQKDPALVVARRSPNY